MILPLVLPSSSVLDSNLNYFQYVADTQSRKTVKFEPDRLGVVVIEPPHHMQDIAGFDHRSGHIKDFKNSRNSFPSFGFRVFGVTITTDLLVSG